MAFAKSLHHAACHLSLFLNTDEERRLCLASKTVQDACLPYRDTFDQPFSTEAQWRQCIQRLHRVTSLRLYANQLGSLRVVKIEHLAKLNISACGLASHNIPNSFIIALRQASSLRHLIVNDNPFLKTSGLAKLLRALAKSGTSLLTLKASNSGIQRLPLVDKPLLARLQTLMLTNNRRLSQNTIPLIFQHLSELESAGFDIFQSELQPILGHNKVAMLSWWRCSSEGIERLISSPQIVCASLFCRFPGRWTWTPATAIGANLRHISIGSVYMPPSAWTLFLTTLATTATIVELRVWATDTPHEALVAFVDHHRNPSHLEALGIAYNAAFTEDHLVLLCQAMRTKRIFLKKWILKGCRRLRLVHSATPFLATLRQVPIHLDLASCQPLNLNRRAEAQWFNQLFQQASFSYLDVSSRCVILEEDVLPLAFQDIENLCLRNAEINWGLEVPMPRLRALCLAGVQTRMHMHADLLHQALAKPRISSLNMDYCHIEHYRSPSKAKCVTSLRLDWISDGDEFFTDFANAIATGHFPSLSTLHILRAAPDAVCEILVSLKGGKRRCCIDARSRRWTLANIYRLFACLAVVEPEDISYLRILIEDSARDVFEESKAQFRCIAFDTK